MEFISWVFWVFILFIYIVISLPFTFRKQKKIINYIKEKHPKLYDKLGKPSFWSASPLFYLKLLFKFEIPNDPIFKRKILFYRISTFIDLIVLFIFFILLNMYFKWW